ncbi:MAG: ABC transporter permease subunit, partial [Firmicutes bacterium]|nr:ABC transporter permease subunit [Bacillota bacterium]
MLLRWAVRAAACFSLAIPLLIIVYILMKGIPHLTLDMFAFEYTSSNASLFPALINTLLMTALALAIAVPTGIFSAIYLVEYAGRGNRGVKVMRMATETLSGIPSIVYGLFGFLMFNIYLGWGYSILGGALTLAIMVLPLIMRTTETALQSVPDAFREGSFGLGAGKLRTV